MILLKLPILNARHAKQAFLFVSDKFSSFILAHKDLFFSLVTVSLTQHDSCKIPSNNKKKEKKTLLAQCLAQSIHSVPGCYCYYIGWVTLFVWFPGFPSVAHKTQNNVLKVASC